MKEMLDKKNYQLVIWDLDGTLLDTSDGLILTAKYLIDNYGLDMPDEDTFKSFVGPRIQDSLKRIYNFDEARINDLSAIYREKYKSENILKAHLYEGIIDTLEIIKRDGKKQAVATNKREDLAELILKEFAITRYMNCICGTDFFGKQTKEDLLYRCINLCGVEKDKVVLVGDSDYDAVAAEKIGIDFVAVMYGFGFKTEDDLLGLSYISTIYKPDEIIKEL